MGERLFKRPQNGFKNFIDYIEFNKGLNVNIWYAEVTL